MPRRCLLLLALILPLAAEGVLRRFPMATYRPLGAPWLEAQAAAPLFPAGYQARKARAFQAHHLAPWDRRQAGALVTAGVLALETRQLAKVEAELNEEAGLGPNYLPYDRDWLARLKARVPGAKADGRPAILVDHAAVRLLPTSDPYLHNPALAGEGYPFDQLQNSVLWAGTPVRMLAVTRDKAWCKVVSADCAGWVRTQSVALAGPGFMAQWRRAVARDGLVAAIRTEAPLEDAMGRSLGQAYVGCVYPRWPAPGPRHGVTVAVRDPRTHEARAVRAFLGAEDGIRQPWTYSPASAAALWRTLLGRPYGWGNLNLHNDCSSELKNFFTPFGLWLPRHSADQAASSRRIDLGGLDFATRRRALLEQARPYVSLLWFPGHVMLYLGPVTDRGVEGFMTYQNLWGLRPQAPPDYRSVVGGAVLFPVLERYPELPGALSLGLRTPFTVTRLDQD